LKVSPEALSVTSRSSPGRGQAFLTLEGEIGPLDIPAMREKVSAALEGEPHDLVVDMRGVWALCQEAVALLAGARARQRSLQRQLTLVFAAESATDRAMKAAGLQGRFTTVRRVPDWHAL
jgi:ABC-type transporter Mla MlaB component